MSATLTATAPTVPVSTGRKLHETLSSRRGRAFVWGLAVLWTVPTFGLFLTSFRPEREIKTSGWWLFFRHPSVTLDNYGSVLGAASGINLSKFFLNSIMITVPAVVISVTLAAMASYAFSWMRFPGRDWLFVLVVAMLVVPLQMAVIPLLRLFTQGAHLGSTKIFPALGVSDSVVGVWIAHAVFGMPFCIFILKNFIAALPKELIDASKIDGAGHLTVFRHVVLPLSLPSLASLTIFQFIYIWNDFFVGKIFGGLENAPVTAKLVEISGNRGQAWHLLTSAAFVSMLVPLVVFNHTAREHDWARRARAGSRLHRHRYLVFPDREMPDAYEATLPEVFPEIAPGNFTWDNELDGWVWTTFHDYQWDLNYGNPDVFVAMLEVMLELANAGVEVLRLDAIAFLWKRLGTDSQNQPECHLLAQAYRALLAIAAPAVLLKAEAIVAPTHVVPYLGAHEVERAECHLAYHNQLSVLLWSSLASGDSRLAVEALEALPATPSAATWITYVRCHDDIGWAVSDDDAARAGLDGRRHRAFLAAFYRGDEPGSWAQGVAFSTNARNADERTCGMAAALCGIDSARERHDAVALDVAVRRLLLLYGVMIAFEGIPAIYMGDELAQANDLSFLGDPTRWSDTRWVHRPLMDWDAAARRFDGATVEGRVFGAFRELLAIRRETSALHGGGRTWVHRLDDPAVLGWTRAHPRYGRFYGLANFSEREAAVPAAALTWAGLREPKELTRQGAIHQSGDSLRIEPLGFAWYADATARSVVPRRPPS